MGNKEKVYYEVHTNKTMHIQTNINNGQLLLAFMRRNIFKVISSVARFLCGR